jgi:hypothetical protein
MGSFFTLRRKIGCKQAQPRRTKIAQVPGGLNEKSSSWLLAEDSVNAGLLDNTVEAGEIWHWIVSFPRIVFSHFFARGELALQDFAPCRRNRDEVYHARS